MRPYMDKTMRPSEQYRSAAPRLAELTQSILAENWERPLLSKRDRCLITCAILTALHRPEQLPFHLRRALGSGLSKEELGEMIAHVAFYSGWPAAVTAAMLARDVFDEA